MNPVSNPRQLVLSYLLGEMPLEERRAVEVQMVSDPGFSHHIRQAELELIEDYRASRMSAEERERVEQAFAREHLFLGLPIRLEPPPPSATSLPLPHSRRWHWWVRLTLATAGIILFVAAAWIAFRYLRPHDALPRSLRKEYPVASSAVNPFAPKALDHATTVLLLAPAVTHGTASAALQLRPGIQTVRVAWVVPANIVARTFSISIFRGSARLATVRQHNALHVIGGSRVAYFRVDAGIFQGYEKHPSYRFEIRAVEHPDMVLAEYPVTVSAQLP